jgi:hypothetical protein
MGFIHGLGVERYMSSNAWQGRAILGREIERE